MTTIPGFTVRDVRFPTSEHLDGSDAMNPDPDYSAAYVRVLTDAGDDIEGHSFVFTIGRGNDLCCRAVEAMRHLVIGRNEPGVQNVIRTLWAAGEQACAAEAARVATGAVSDARAPAAR